MKKIISFVVTLSVFLALNSTNLLAAEPTESRNHSLTKVAGNPAAPDFNLEDQNGNFIRLSDYKGQVVIINFWATWCPPCRKEMPSMQRAWEVLEKEDIVMLAINVGEDSDLIFAFTAEYPVEFPLLMDRTSEIVRNWKVRGLPTTFIVNPAGKIVYQAIGDRDWDAPEILDKIRKLKNSTTISAQVSASPVIAGKNR